MATNNLEVKFKVDASEVTRGSEDAKNKVKNAANEMASDVKNSSRQMEASMKDVSRATEGIGNATKTATTAVKQMEREVDVSAKNMEKSLKNISARQIGGLVARGLGQVGSQITENLGDTEEGAMAGGALKGASSGIMMGAIAGPLGMAAGGLIGAATGLMQAAVELKSAAQDQKIANFKTADDFRKDIINRQEAEGRRKEVQNALGLFDTAEGNEGKRFAINRAQELVDDRQSAYEEARKRYYDLGMNSNLTGNNEEDKKTLAAIAAAKEEMDKAALAFQEVSPLIAAITQAEQQIEQSIVGEINETKKRLDEQETRRQKMEDAARLAAEEDENERLAKRLEYGMVATTPEEAEEIDDKIAKLEEEKKKKDNTLKGAFTDVGIRQTDSLTRIGGGTGYASYNNTTTQIQKNIESSLKTVISVLKDQTAETSSKLDALIAKDNTMVWANP